MVAAALGISHHVSFLEMFRLVLGVSALLGIAFSFPLGWIAARRAMAPLRQLAQLAGSVSADRLAERLPRSSAFPRRHSMGSAGKPDSFRCPPSG